MSTVYTSREHQIEMCLPAHPTDGLLRERLARAVAEYDAATTLGERLALRDEIDRLRAILEPKGAVQRG